MTPPRDTDPAAYERYVAALRAMSPQERLLAAASMSVEVRRLAEAGVRRRHPEYDDAAVLVALDALFQDDSNAPSRPRRGQPVSG